MSKIFLSYARGDDEPFVRRLHADLTHAGFEVWFDRVSMPSRQLTFLHEIRDAVAACERLLLVIGPKAITSDYVTQEWQFAYFAANKCINPVVRLDDMDASGQRVDGYSLIPEDLKLLHAEDFRDDSSYAEHLKNLLGQLSEHLPPAGRLVGVPELPPNYRAQPERLQALRNLLLQDLQKPVVVTGALARVGLHGMGGIGKSVLATALARHPEVRRGFKDGIFWISLGETPRLIDIQRHLARQLGDDGLFSDEVSGREKLRELLAHRSVLILLDNVWQRDHADAFNVVSPTSRILLTTRDIGLVSAFAAPGCHYQLQLPTQAEAEAILASAAQVDPSALTHEARMVVAECGRLPLALALCGGMVQDGTPWRDLLEALREHDLAFLSAPYPAEEQHQSVWKAIDVSLRILPEDQRERFAELTVFVKAVGATGTAVSTLWAHKAGMTPRQSRKLLADFARRSLLQLNPMPPSEGQDNVRIGLHDLVRNFAEGVAHKQFGSPVALHETLLHAYRKICPNGWSTGPNDGYFLQNLRHHLAEAGQSDELCALLLDLRWFEAKAASGLIFDLLEDFRHARGVDATDFQHKYLLPLIEEAIRHDIHFIFRHPTMLFQCLWNKCWWHDASLKPGGTVKNITATETVGVDQPTLLCELVERWRKVKEIESGGLSWIRTMWPPVKRLGEAPSMRTLRGHEGTVTSVAWSPDGARILTGSRDGTVRVWDALNALELVKVKAVTENRNPVFSVGWSPDGRNFISGGTDGVLHIWDAESGRKIQRLQYPISKNTWVLTVSYSPNGRLIASGASNFYGTGDNTVRLWDSESGECLGTLGQHEERIRALTWSADGGKIISGGDDGRVIVWDINTGVELKFSAGESPVLSVACSPDGRTVVAGSWDRTARVWDIRTGQELACLTPHDEAVQAVTFTPDGSFIITGTGAPQQGSAARVSARNSIRRWDSKSYKEINSYVIHDDGVTCIAASPKNGEVASGSEDNSATIFQLGEKNTLASQSHHDAMIRCIAASPDDSLIVTGDIEGSIFLWDTKSGKGVKCLLKEPLIMIDQIWFSPEGDKIIARISFKSMLVDVLPGEKPAYIFSGDDFAECKYTDNPPERPAVASRDKFVITRSGNDLCLQSKDTGAAVAWFPVDLENSYALRTTCSWVVTDRRNIYYIRLETSGEPGADRSDVLDPL